MFTKGKASGNQQELLFELILAAFNTILISLFRIFFLADEVGDEDWDASMREEGRGMDSREMVEFEGQLDVEE